MGALLGKETDLASRRALANSNYELAHLTWKVGRQEEALGMHRAVLAAREAMAASRLGVVLWWRRQASEAEGQIRRALELYRELADENPAVPEFRATLAQSHSNLGQLLEQLGRQRDAEVEFRAAVGLWEQLRGVGYNAGEARAQLAVSHYRVGMVRGRVGDRDGAIDSYREAARVDGDRIGLANYALGRALIESGRLDEAMAVYRRAITIDATDGRGLAAVAVVLFRSGRPAEAARAARDAVRLLDRRIAAEPGKAEHPEDLARAVLTLADALRATALAVEARDAYDRAVAIAESLGREPPPRGNPIGRLAVVRSAGALRASVGSTEAPWDQSPSVSSDRRAPNWSVVFDDPVFLIHMFDGGPAQSRSPLPAV